MDRYQKNQDNLRGQMRWALALSSFLMFASTALATDHAQNRGCLSGQDSTACAAVIGGGALAGVSGAAALTGATNQQALRQRPPQIMHQSLNGQMEPNRLQELVGRLQPGDEVDIRYQLGEGASRRFEIARLTKLRENQTNTAEEQRLRRNQIEARLAEFEQRYQGQDSPRIQQQRDLLHSQRESATRMARDYQSYANQTGLQIENLRRGEGPVPLIEHTRRYTVTDQNRSQIERFIAERLDRGSGVTQISRFDARHVRQLRNAGHFMRGGAAGLALGAVLMFDESVAGTSSNALRQRLARTQDTDHSQLQAPAAPRLRPTISAGTN